MKFRKSLPATMSSTITLASMLLVSACSTGPQLPQTAIQASIPARLLVAPAELPQIQRTADPITGELTISGTQCLTGAADLYDVAGGIRGQLLDLQAAVKARDAAPEKPKKKHFRLF